MLHARRALHALPAGLRRRVPAPHLPDSGPRHRHGLPAHPGRRPAPSRFPASTRPGSSRCSKPAGWRTSAPPTRSAITTATAAWTPTRSGPIHEVPIFSDDGALRDEGTIRVTDMAFDEGVLLDQDRFLTAVLARPEVPAQDDRHRTALPARQVLRRRRNSATAWPRACSPPATRARHPHFRRRARRWQRVSEFHEALGHAPGRPDSRLRIRSRPARRSVRSLRLPSLGTVRSIRCTRSER